MAEQEPIISVQGVSKTFKLPHQKNSSIKSALINFKGSKKTYSLQKALDNISFEIKKGEFMGIVGRNGSGKSTLLKLLAGIYTPTTGSIQVNGKLTPFIELGVGFNPELTGRENVFLNGALLGFNRKQMEEMYDSIVSFAELEQFMDQKLKNYSSGMQVRLAFSIAIRAQSDILLIDEVLAVGDAAFQQKCFDYFKELRKSGATVCLVTHDMDAVKRFCDKAILIHKGKLTMAGEPIRVAQEYDKLNFDATLLQQETDKTPEKTKPYYDYKVVTKGNKRMYGMNDTVELNMSLVFKDGKTRRVAAGISIVRKDSGLLVAATNSFATRIETVSDKEVVFTLKFKAGQLTRGNYDLDFFVLDVDLDYQTIIQEQQVLTIKVTEYDKARWGVFNIEGEWS